VNLRQTQGRPFVIGHRGAARIARENTLDGLAAAVDAGADLVEFDVGPGLELGHPGGPASELTLDDALAYLAPLPIGIHVDLKAVGIEREVVAAAARHAVEERVIVSTTWVRSLRRLAHEAPGITRAISYPRDRYGAGSVTWPRLFVAGTAACVRPAMHVRMPPLLAAARADALSLHHALVSASLVRAAHGRGAAVIAWTVNDPARIEALALLDVDAIVSDDPRMALEVLATLNSP
jgi:glycerophosphoryl diester phosphodiesterase